MKELIVEGDNDMHVVFALRDKHQLPKNFEVKALRSVEQVILGIPGRIKESNLNVLGIVIDADTDLNKRWREVKAQFEEFGYKFPDSPKASGTIIESPDKILPYPQKVGVWLMPNNQLTGAIEEFMQMLIRDNDLVWAAAQEATAKVETDLEVKIRFSTKARSKALIHNYLAWQKEPGKPLGFSITKKYFNADAALAQQFIKWLNDLFN